MREMPGLMPTERPRRRPRLAGRETRARILDAAQVTFSAKGYAQSLISDIAEAAEVSSALVIQHFHTKAALFEEALSGALDEIAELAAKDDFAELMTEVLSDGVPAQRARLMLVHSIGAEEVRETASRLVHERLIAPLAKTGGEPHGFERAAVALAVGYATLGMLLPAKRGELGNRRLVGKMIGETLQSMAA
jgi:AcrR family transcriptional regulator